MSALPCFFLKSYFLKHKGVYPNEAIFRLPCYCEERSGVAISRYHPPRCIAKFKIVPGDCHGPKGPRNDMIFDD